jgi:vancomycin resistance protein YoaR
MTFRAMPSRETIRWGVKLIVFFLLLCGAGVLALLADMRRFDNRILTNVVVGSIDVSGLTEAEAATHLSDATNSFYVEGVALQYDSASATLYPIISSPDDPDLTYPVIEWNIAGTVNNAMLTGRRGEWWQRGATHIYTRLIGAKLQALTTVHEDALAAVLSSSFPNALYPAQDATLMFDDQGMLFIDDATAGQDFPTARVAKDVAKIASALVREPILLSTETTYPSVTRGDLARFKSAAMDILARAPISITAAEVTWTVDAPTLASFIQTSRDAAGIRLTTDGTATRAFLADRATTLNTAPVDARFTLDDGRVNDFTAARNGRTLNIDATIAALDDALFREKTEIAAVIDTTTPLVLTSAVNNFGIVELIGTGYSSFAGSPANRRHNIAVGAAALHGVLIAPDEEFSLVKTLGNIDAASGYKKELVIKGGKTIPEYGGGLCQIGTTAFRGVMASALPVTERRNHAYSVSYYLENDLPGTDATIYGPHPDFRFVNDTGKHILIQSRIEGDDLYFEFWGTRDGRSSSRTTPRIWNVRQPPPAKIIETTDLPPGEKRCTEIAHNGMNAEFSYSIVYADGEERDQVFRSSYRPWQAVCLIGVEPDTENDEEL